jgi:hypothetical protein
MPDLQSELSKAITAWQEPETPAKPAHLFQPTTNTTRVTFEFVRDNPGIKRTAAIAKLAAQGHNAKSVGSLITQFVRQGRMRDSNGGVYTTVSEYTPLKGSSSVRAAKRAAAKKADYAARVAKSRETRARKAALRTELEDKALLGPVEAPAVTPAPPFDASVWVDGLTLKQAKAVYEELKKVFG